MQDVVSDICSLYTDGPVRPHEFDTASAQDLFSAHGAYWTDASFWKNTLQMMGVLDLTPAALQ